MESFGNILTGIVTVVSLLSLILSIRLNYQKFRSDEKDDLRKDYERMKDERDKLLDIRKELEKKIEVLEQKVDALEKNLHYIEGLVKSKSG